MAVHRGGAALAYFLQPCQDPMVGELLQERGALPEQGKLIVADDVALSPSEARVTTPLEWLIVTDGH